MFVRWVTIIVLKYNDSKCILYASSFVSLVYLMIRSGKMAMCYFPFCSRVIAMPASLIREHRIMFVIERFLSLICQIQTISGHLVERKRFLNKKEREESRHREGYREKETKEECGGGRENEGVMEREREGSKERERGRQEN